MGLRVHAIVAKLATRAPRDIHKLLRSPKIIIHGIDPVAIGILANQAE